MWTIIGVVVLVYVAYDLAVETSAGRTWSTTHP